MPSTLAQARTWYTTAFPELSSLEYDSILHQFKTTNQAVIQQINEIDGVLGTGTAEFGSVNGLTRLTDLVDIFAKPNAPHIKALALNILKKYAELPTDLATGSSNPATWQTFLQRNPTWSDGKYKVAP
jgi:hypothetical protein